MIAPKLQARRTNKIDNLRQPVKPRVAGLSPVALAEGGSSPARGATSNISLQPAYGQELGILTRVSRAAHSQKISIFLFTGTRSLTAFEDDGIVVGNPI